MTCTPHPPSAPLHAFFFPPSSCSSSSSSAEAIIALLCTDIIRQQRLTEALALIRCERTPTCHFKLCCRIFPLIYSLPVRFRRGCGRNNKSKDLQTRRRSGEKKQQKENIHFMKRTSNFPSDPLTTVPPPNPHTHTLFQQ